MNSIPEVRGIPIPHDEKTGLEFAVFSLRGSDKAPDGIGSDAYEKLHEDVYGRTKNTLQVNELEALEIVNLALRGDPKAWAWAHTSLVDFIRREQPIPRGLKLFAEVAHTGVQPLNSQGRKKWQNEFRNRMLVRTVSSLVDHGFTVTSARSIAGRALGKLGYGELTGDAVRKAVNSYQEVIDDQTYFNRCLVQLGTPGKK